jgi:hypothetical protein
VSGLFRFYASRANRQLVFGAAFSVFLRKGMEVGLGSFKVAIVERGKEALWRSYWVESEREGTAVEAPSALGRTQVVEASSLDEAIDAVQRDHPDCTVMLAGGEHHIS